MAERIVYNAQTGQSTTETYTPESVSAPTPEQLAAQIRSDRDAKLQASTWLVERHREELEAGTTTLTTEQFRALLDYRQALRDITEQAGFPNSVVFPEYPPN